MATNITGGVQIRVPQQNAESGPIQLSREDVGAVVQAARARYANFDAIKDRFEFRLKNDGDGALLELKQRNFWGRLKESTFGRTAERQIERQSALTAVARALGSEPASLGDIRSSEGLQTDRLAARHFARQIIARLAADVAQVISNPESMERPAQAEAHAVVSARLQRSLQGARFAEATHVQRAALNDLEQPAGGLTETLTESLSFIEQYVADKGDLRIEPVDGHSRLIGLIGQVLHAGKRLASEGNLAPALGERLNTLRERYYGLPMMRQAADYALNILSCDARSVDTTNFPDDEVYLLPFAQDRIALVQGAAMDSMMSGRATPFGDGVEVLGLKADGSIDALTQPGVKIAAHQPFDFMADQLAQSESHAPTRAHVTSLLGHEAAIRPTIEAGLLSEFTPITDSAQQGEINTAIARCVTEPELMCGRTDRWPEMALTDAHKASLRTAMTRLGFQDTDREFGRFLLSLAAIYMKGSGTSHFGSEGSSIIAMRAYACILAETAARIDPELAGVLERNSLRGALRANVCADQVGNAMLARVHRLDRAMAESVIPPRMLSHREDAEFEGNVVQFGVIDHAMDELSDAGQSDGEVMDIDDIVDNLVVRSR